MGSVLTPGCASKWRNPPPNMHDRTGRCLFCDAFGSFQHIVWECESRPAGLCLAPPADSLARRLAGRWGMLERTLGGANRWGRGERLDGGQEGPGGPFTRLYAAAGFKGPHILEDTLHADVACLAGAPGAEEAAAGPHDVWVEQGSGYLASLDWSQAYDRMDSEATAQLLQRLGWPSSLTTLIRQA